MLLSRTTGLGRLALKKAKAPGKPRGFGSVPPKTSRTGKTDADKTGTSRTGTDRTGSSSDDSIPTIDTSRLRLPSLPDFSGSRILSDLSDSSRRSGLSQPFDIELLSSFTSRHVGVDSLLVPKFEGPLAVLNDYGVGPTSTLKFLERLEDKEWFGKFAGVVQQHALDVTKGYGRSFRLDVPFHQYKILSRMHDAGTFAEDWLHTSSSKDMVKELVGWFPAGGKLDGGVAVLGRSGIVVPSHFVDYDRGGVRVSGCLMTTSEYHALDGYLAWMVFHFMRAGSSAMPPSAAVSTRCRPSTGSTRSSAAR